MFVSVVVSEHYVGAPYFEGGGVKPTAGHAMVLHWVNPTGLHNIFKD